MSSSNNRTINGYETIEGELVLSEITNSVLVTDSDGLVYGINNYISNLTSDAQTQINTINNNITTIEGEITTMNTNIGDKQNLSLNNVSSTWTANIGNYNYDFRRNDTNGQNFYIGNCNISTTATSNLYLSGPNNNSAFSISVGNANTRLTHNNSGSFVFNS